MKSKESSVTFDETPPPSKTSPLVDDDIDEEETIKVTKKKHLENDIEDETLEIDVELVPEPKNMTIIGTKWLFRNKLDENGVVSQNKARLVAQEMLKKFGLEDSNTMKTPMSSDTKLTKDEECELVDSTKYRGMIGTTHLGLWYPKGTGIETVVYADSDHAGDYVDRKSTSDSVMSSASSVVTYTSVYTDFEPGSIFLGADEELSNEGSPRVIVYGYDGLPMQPVALPSLDYVPGPEHPPSPIKVPYVPKPEYPEYLVPFDAEAPLEDQPLPIDASPTALSPGYVADSDPEEDPEEDHVDYPADEGDDDDEPTDDDDDTDDKDEEPFEYEDDDEEEEEEHLAPADSFVVPIIDHVPSAEDIRGICDLMRRTCTAKVEILFALHIPPPSPLTSLSSPLPQIPSPHLPPPVPTSLPLPLSLLPPLPASLYIPPVDRREDTFEAELPPRKRLCLTALTPRYEVGESSTAAPRPTGGHGADYGFISTMNVEIQCQRVEEVGYSIRGVWVDPLEAIEGTAQMTLEGVNDKVTELSAVQEQDTHDIYAFHYQTAWLLDQEALVSQEAWTHSIGLSMIVHYGLQAYRTHTQMQDYRIALQESLVATLIAYVSSLQGQLSAALGQIQALQARDQTHADDPEGAGSSA
ncbi:hypothetical protein Tco_1533225 [Tanacetum coccineum]